MSYCRSNGICASSDLTGCTCERGHNFTGFNLPPSATSRSPPLSHLLFTSFLCPGRHWHVGDKDSGHVLSARHVKETNCTRHDHGDGEKDSWTCQQLWENAQRCVFPGGRERMSRRLAVARRREWSMWRWTLNTSVLPKWWVWFLLLLF